MSKTRYRRGDQHPQNPSLFFWQYHRKQERWVTREQFDQYRSKDVERARARHVRERRITDAVRKKRARAKAIRHNKLSQIRAYLERGKSEAFIMTACDVPLSVIRDAQQSA